MNMCERAGIWHSQMFVVTNFLSSFYLGSLRGSSSLEDIRALREPESRRAGPDASPQPSCPLNRRKQTQLALRVSSFLLVFAPSILTLSSQAPAHPHFSFPLGLYSRTSNKTHKNTHLTLLRAEHGSGNVSLTEHKEERTPNLTCETVLSLLKMHD